MIPKQEIMALAAELQLQAHVVEKDYALGWFLAGIAAHPVIGARWAFKGGTCLKKCYFETYRFSEDLDFTLTDAAHLDGTFLKRVFGEVGQWIYDRTGIEIPAGQTLALKPGSYHVMLLDLKQQVKDGDTVPITLEFVGLDNKKHTMEIKAPARPLNASAASADGRKH